MTSTSAWMRHAVDLRFVGSFSAFLCHFMSSLFLLQLPHTFDRLFSSSLVTSPLLETINFLSSGQDGESCIPRRNGVHEFRNCSRTCMKHS